MTTSGTLRYARATTGGGANSASVTVCTPRSRWCPVKRRAASRHAPLPPGTEDDAKDTVSQDRERFRFHDLSDSGRQKRLEVLDRTRRAATGSPFLSEAVVAAGSGAADALLNLTGDLDSGGSSGWEETTESSGDDASSEHSGGGDRGGQEDTGTSGDDSESSSDGSDESSCDGNNESSDDASGDASEDDSEEDAAAAAGEGGGGGETGGGEAAGAPPSGQPQPEGGKRRVTGRRRKRRGKRRRRRRPASPFVHTMLSAAQASRAQSRAGAAGDGTSPAQGGPSVRVKLVGSETTRIVSVPARSLTFDALRAAIVRDFGRHVAVTWVDEEGDTCLISRPEEWAAAADAQTQAAAAAAAVGALVSPLRLLVQPPRTASERASVVGGWVAEGGGTFAAPSPWAEEQEQEEPVPSRTWGPGEPPAVGRSPPRIGRARFRDAGTARAAAAQDVRMSPLRSPGGGGADGAHRPRQVTFWPAGAGNDGEGEAVASPLRAPSALGRAASAAALSRGPGRPDPSGRGIPGAGGAARRRPETSASGAHPRGRDAREGRPRAQTSYAGAGRVAAGGAGVRSWQRGRLLGRGSYGKVYGAMDLATGRWFAVKQVRIREDEASVQAVAALEREVALLRRLSHPNIVAFLGTERTASRLYIQLELCSGGSLLSALQRWGPVSEAALRSYVRHAVRGLAYLHASGVIHRDIKCGNMLVDEATGQVKLADFGCSKVLALQSVGGGACSQDVHTMAGTVQFMAPEAMQRDVPFGRKADIWSLGMAVVEMATGKPAWANPATAVYKACFTDELPPLPDTLSDDALDFLSRCFRRDPAERPAAAELLEHPFLCDTVPDPRLLRPTTGAAGGGGRTGPRTDSTGSGADWRTARGEVKLDGEGVREVDDEEAEDALPAAHPPSLPTWARAESHGGGDAEFETGRDWGMALAARGPGPGAALASDSSSDGFGPADDDGAGDSDLGAMQSELRRLCAE